MSRPQTVKNNALLGGSSLISELYATPEDFDEVFENLDKPSEVIAAPRPTFIRPGVLTTVKGSAYMEYGKTKVLAIVTPPRELSKSVKRAPLGIVNCYVNFAAFATPDIESVPQREKDLGSGLRKALEPMLCRNEFAGFQMDIRALILDDDGCLLSTALNCCGVALLECGISAYDLITSSTVCIYRGVVFFNPDLKVEKLLTSRLEKDDESSLEHGIVTTACLSSFDQIAECIQSGYLTPDTFIKLVEYTIAINKQLAETVSHILVERVHDQYESELRDKAEEALEDQRITDLIALMQLQKVDKTTSNVGKKSYSKTTKN